MKKIDAYLFTSCVMAILGVFFSVFTCFMGVGYYNTYMEQIKAKVPFTTSDYVCYGVMIVMIVIGVVDTFFSFVAMRKSWKDYREWNKYNN